MKAGASPKAAANWISVEFLRLLNDHQISVTGATITPQNLAELIAMVDGGTVSALAAKTVFAHLFEKGGAPADVVSQLGLAQISDEAQLAAAVDEAIAENPDAVANFRAGNEKSIGFLVGQVMRKSAKRANPQLVNRLLREKLS